MMHTLNQTAHVTIIILNWNGWQDTIECLESVLKLDYPNFNIILIDNHSGNDSVEQIAKWLKGESSHVINSDFPDLITPYEPKPLNFYHKKIQNISEWNINIKSKIIFIQCEENLGFALANNFGIKIAKELFDSEYFFLLNNDTVIHKDALTYLVHTVVTDQQLGAIQAVIYHYENPEIIANAGGRIFLWAQTKYYREIKEEEVKKISFINGCALLVRSSLVKSNGLFSEKFFFGEEDFEFSMRMKRYNIPLACHGSSRVFHKIGISSSKLLKNHERMVFLFGLNRIIDMKDFYPRAFWEIWRIISALYFGFLCIIHYKTKIRPAFQVIHGLLKYTRRIHDVKKDTVDKIFGEFQLG